MADILWTMGDNIFQLNTKKYEFQHYTRWCLRLKKYIKTHIFGEKSVIFVHIWNAYNNFIKKYIFAYVTYIIISV